MRFPNAWSLVSFLALLGELGFAQSPQVNHGLVGYGITMDDPLCAFACQAVLTGSQLSCSTPMDMVNTPMGSMVMSSPFMTSLDCYASDDAFLPSLALCIQTRCTEQPIWQIGNFWATSAVGTMSPQPNPKYSYQQALYKITNPPNVTLVYGSPLNETSLVGDSDYDLQYRILDSFSWVEIQHSKFCLVLFCTGFLLPIFLSLLRFIPFPAPFTQVIALYLIYPPLLGKRHFDPLPHDAGLMPTRGQALFIFYLIVINAALSATGYRAADPTSYYSSKSAEITAYVANRLGVLSFANLPLLILYSGRNNILLWLTDWSHGTFLLLHRWIGYICVLEAALHSAIYLQVYITEGFYSIEINQPYWYWGAIATLSLSFIVPLSILPVRRKWYEIFLVSHFVLVLLALVGCYLHIWYNYQNQWGYELWIYIAFAIWAFDRFSRLLRMARNGLRRATFSAIDDDYLRVDINSVAADGHAYLYFPTLSWRFWENHPFSVAATVHFLPSNASRKPLTGEITRSVSQDVEKEPTIVYPVQDAAEIHIKSDSDTTNLHAGGDKHHIQATPTLGLTFFMRRCSGVTSHIRARVSLPVLVESPYGSHSVLYEYPTLVCIAGGVGITAVLTRIRSHPGRVMLYWGLRSAKLAEAMQKELACVGKEVKIGSRFNIRAVVQQEIDNGKGNLAFFVCGPPSMADAARVAVIELARRRVNGKVKLIQECFSW